MKSDEIQLNMVGKGMWFPFKIGGGLVGVEIYECLRFRMFPLVKNGSLVCGREPIRFWTAQVINNGFGLAVVGAPA